MRRFFAMLGLASVVFVGGTVALDTATAQPAQASVGSTVLFNDTTAPIWVTVGGHYDLLVPQQNTARYGGTATSFSVPRNWCGFWNVNYGVHHALDGGWTSVPAGIVHVVQLRCPNGQWTENL